MFFDKIKQIINQLCFILIISSNHLNLTKSANLVRFKTGIKTNSQDRVW
jgi:hypothetical protein